MMWLPIGLSLVAIGLSVASVHWSRKVAKAQGIISKREARRRGLIT